MAIDKLTHYKNKEVINNTILKGKIIKKVNKYCTSVFITKVSKYVFLKTYFITMYMIHIDYKH